MVVPVFKNPVIDKPIEDTEELIDHLKFLLEKTFANDVSQIFYGDVGVYLPDQFLGPRKERRAILALSPAYDRLEEGSRTAASEVRLIGIDIIGMVDITPYFKASPKEAYGERQLSALMRKLRVFLTQRENSTLDGRVQYLNVGDVNWAWMRRENLSIRGAALEVSARVRVSRQKNLQQ